MCQLNFVGTSSTFTLCQSIFLCSKTSLTQPLGEKEITSNYQEFLVKWLEYREKYSQEIWSLYSLCYEVRQDIRVWDNEVSLYIQIFIVPWFCNQHIYRSKIPCYKGSVLYAILPLGFHLKYIVMIISWSV